jgi:hypothetical protein
LSSYRDLLSRCGKLAQSFDQRVVIFNNIDALSGKKVDYCKHGDASGWGEQLHSATMQK